MFVNIEDILKTFEKQQENLRNESSSSGLEVDFNDIC